MTTTAFPDAARIDAHDKVRGATRYASDESRPGMLHATLACATIGRGRIRSMDTEAARAALAEALHRSVLLRRDPVAYWQTFQVVPPLIELFNAGLARAGL